MQKKFEYTTFLEVGLPITNLFLERMNLLGSEGWELVSVTQRNLSKSEMIALNELECEENNYCKKTPCYTAFFKREIV